MLFKAIIAGIIGALAFCGVSFAQTCPAYTYTLANGTTADATQVMANFNAMRTCVNAITQPALRGYISGLTLTTAGSSGTFAVSSGVATDSAAASSMSLSSAYAKTTNTWASGSGNGCLDTGAVANNTWYHAFLIQRIDTGVVDVLCSTSATAPTLPSPYTRFRRIGSMKTSGSAQWIAFRQSGDEFFWTVPAIDWNSQPLDTTPIALALSVPSGVNVDALFSWTYFNQAGTASYLYFTSYWQSAVGADINHAQGQYNSQLQNLVAGQLLIRTDTASQIRAVASTGTGSRVFISTQGWVDQRGRND